MRLPSRVDVLRTSFTLGWLALAIGTLSWKAPWFWRAVPQHALEAPAASPPRATEPSVESASAGAAPASLARPPAPARQAPVARTVVPARWLPQPGVGPRGPSIRDRLLIAAAQHEEAGRFDTAIQVYHFVQAMNGTLGPDERLRLARALRWSGRLRHATAAYQAYLESVAAPRAGVRGELGVTLVDAGAFAEALPHLDAAAQSSPSDETLYIATATAADGIGEPARAAEALLHLATLRRLSPAEAMWLGGRLETSGNVERGLPAIYAALDEAPDASLLWERAGDLEWTQSRYARAVDAYDRVPQDCGRTPVILKAARAAARAGHNELSARRYASAIGCDPSGPVLLEAARLHGSRGAPERALAYYEPYAASAEPPADVWLEMAQTALAAGRPALALEWAEAGIARSGHTAPLAFARAQALQMLNRSREAEATLAAILPAEPRNGAWLTWLGRAAFAQGHHLAAFQLFSRALGTALDDRAQVLVAHGDAAAARGDLARARTSYRSALAVARNPEAYDVEPRLEALHTRSRPELRVPFETFRDANGVAVRQGGAELTLHATDALRLRTRWTTGTVEQGSYRFGRRALAIRAEDIFVTPSFRLDAGAGVEDYAGATLAVWDVRVRRDFTGGASATLQALRQTPWSAETRLGTPRYNRISDLPSLGPSFHATGVRGLMELPLPGRQALRLDAGWQQHSDANEQVDVYVHLQRELASGADGATWVALQPQVYYEGWAGERAMYFSPRTHVGAGLGVRAQLRRAGWTFDGTATPQLLSTDGGRGFGFFGSAGAARQIGPVWLGADATLFDDRRSRYRVHRLAAEVRIPLGR